MLSVVEKRIRGWKPMLALALAVALGTVLPTRPVVAQNTRPNGNLEAVRLMPIQADGGMIEASESDPVVSAEDPGSQELTTTLSLADVIASVYRSYPEINQARQELRRASGQLVEANGSFDTVLEGYTLSEPLGFYENYRNGIGVARKTWWGGYVSAGYRIGRGDFQPWYKERQTNEGGEFSLAFAQALIRGREIDPQRVAVFRACLEQRLAAPTLQQAILDASLEATAAYWTWIAAGAFLQAQRELADLAEARGQQFETGVQAGKFAEIDLILNRQLIAERRVKMLRAEQKYQATAFKLSLFLRDDAGQPLVPDDPWLPPQFPTTRIPELLAVQQLITQAVATRPEPRSLQLQLRQLELDRRLATNQMLPTVNLIAEGSQDVGVPATVINDKGPFQLQVGVVGALPIQRRKAMGKRLATSAKITQLNEKLRLQRDKIGTEVQTAFNALTMSQQIVEQAEISLRNAFESLDRYRFAFERGKVDLIYLNLLETKANETEIELVRAQQDWFISLGRLQSALGLDPLEQAISVAQLPPSDRPGPGRLPDSQ